MTELDYFFFTCDSRLIILYTSIDHSYFYTIMSFVNMVKGGLISLV